MVLYTAIDSVTNGYLDRVAKTMFPQWQETTTYSYQMSHFSGNIDDLHTEYVYSVIVHAFIFTLHENVHSNILGHTIVCHAARKKMHSGT